MNLERAVLMMARVEVAAINGRYDQGSWGRLDGVGYVNTEVVVDAHGEPIGFGTCGTARCAAGWALFDSPRRLRWDESGGVLYAVTTDDGREVPDSACEWLDIPIATDRNPDRDEDDNPVFENDEPDDPRWNYDEDMPHLFDAGNTLEQVYERVMEYLPGISRAHFDEMVMAKIVDLHTAATQGVSR